MIKLMSDDEIVLNVRRDAAHDYLDIRTTLAYTNELKELFATEGISVSDVIELSNVPDALMTWAAYGAGGTTTFKVVQAFLMRHQHKRVVINGVTVEGMSPKQTKEILEAVLPRHDERDQES